MTKSILVSFAVLALSTSSALAAQRTHHHRHAMNAHASMGAPPPVASPIAPMGGPGGMSDSNYTSYMRNLHDSGYDPKGNYDANGVLKTQ